MVAGGTTEHHVSQAGTGVLRNAVLRVHGNLVFSGDQRWAVLVHGVCPAPPNRVQGDVASSEPGQLAPLLAPTEVTLTG